MWVGCGEDRVKSEDKKREPIITLITAPVRARPQQNIEEKKKNILWEQKLTQMVCVGFTAKIKTRKQQQYLGGAISTFK